MARRRVRSFSGALLRSVVSTEGGTCSLRRADALRLFLSTLTVMRAETLDVVPEVGPIVTPALTGVSE